MTNPSASYRFIPLVHSGDPLAQAPVDKIVQPEWGDQVSHDVPFSDGVMGTLDLEVTNHTPLFIRGVDPHQPNLPYQTPQQHYGIPGTSLKGMLRGLLEAISFGKMSFVSPTRGSVRDLNNAKVYRDFVTAKEERKDRKSQYRPLTKAGWLDVSNPDQWMLTPCHHWRIETTRRPDRDTGSISDLLEADRKWDKVETNPITRLEWLGDLAWTDMYFKGDDEVKPQYHPSKQGSNGMYLVYRKVYEVSKRPFEGYRAGRLVVTGKPSDRKHLEFVFQSPHDIAGVEPIALNDQVKRDYIATHSEGAEQHRTSARYTAAAKFWMKTAKSQGTMIPVFYLQHEGEVSAVGMAQMLRLPYKYSPAELFERYLNKGSSQPTALDFAELLFGVVDRTPQNPEESLAFTALRGRVQVETARSTDAQLGELIEAVLGGPKISYYPFYVQQSHRDGRVKNIGKGQKYQAEYRTWMDAEALPAGFKRYPRTISVRRPPRPTAEQSKVKTSFTPLRSGATFKTRLYVHNLKPEELGALLWAIDFGGRSECWHQLGMAKGFGYGSVSLKISGHDITDMHAQMVDLESTRQAFIDYMSDCLLGCWEESEQLLYAINFATPCAPRSNLEHMSLEGKNFSKVKQDGLVLPHPVDQHLDRRKAIVNEKKSEGEARREARKALIKRQLLADRAHQQKILADRAHWALQERSTRNIVASLLDNLSLSALVDTMRYLGPYMGEGLGFAQLLEQAWESINTPQDLNKEQCLLAIKERADEVVTEQVRTLICNHEGFASLKRGDAQIGSGSKKQKELVKPFVASNVGQVAPVQSKTEALVEATLSEKQSYIQACIEPLADKDKRQWFIDHTTEAREWSEADRTAYFDEARKWRHKKDKKYNKFLNRDLKKQLELNG